MFVTYYPLTLVIVGTLFNSFTFFILCRLAFQDTGKRPTIHYMRVVAIFGILMLYGWNLDHYLWGAYGFTLQLYFILYHCASCSHFLTILFHKFQLGYVFSSVLIDIYHWVVFIKHGLVNRKVFSLSLHPSS
jgi:hypothetical protein